MKDSCLKQEYAPTLRNERAGQGIPQEGLGTSLDEDRPLQVKRSVVFLVLTYSLLEFVKHTEKALDVKI